MIEEVKGKGGGAAFDIDDVVACKEIKRKSMDEDLFGSEVLCGYRWETATVP